MTPSRLRSSLAALLGILLSLPGLAGAQPVTHQPRSTIFVSDLHLGPGRLKPDASGNFTLGDWHPFEDFRWTEEFGLFLRAALDISRDRSSPVDLVILGDLFELWQAADPASCNAGPASKDLGCSEADALVRLNRILGAHRADLRLLRDFANAGSNQVHIVPGNHDAALVFPKVRDAVIAAIGAELGRVTVRAEGYWLSSDGLIFAEHGHDAPEDVNHYEALPASCLNAKAEKVPCSEPGAFLRRPWGEQFVQGYYNQFEEKFPIIDNVAGEAEAIRYAVSEARIIDVLSAVGDGLGFLVSGQSSDQAAALLGRERSGSARPGMLGESGFHPRYDIRRFRAEKDALFVLGAFLNDTDYMVVEARRLVAAGKLDARRSIAALSDAEIELVCQFRTMRWQGTPESGRRAEDLCPLLDANDVPRLNAIVTNFTHTEAALARNRMNSRAAIAAPVSRQRDGRFRYYVYGHTHQAHGLRPVDTDDPQWKPSMINTGAWQRTATAPQLYKMSLLRKAAGKDGVLNQEPEVLPPCYTYVYVSAYGPEGPEPRLLYWVLENRETKNWRTSTSCPRDYEEQPPYPPIVGFAGG